MNSATLDQEAPPKPPSRFTLSQLGVIVILALLNFTHFVDFVILMPLGARIMDELAITPDQFGNLIAAYGFGAALTGLIAGSVVDRFNRKSVLLLAYVGFAIGTAGCGLASRYEEFLVARFVAGACGGLAGGTILAIIGDLFPPHLRGSATGAVMSAFGFASVVGLPAGILLTGEFGRQAPFYGITGLSGLIALLALWKLPPLRGHIANNDDDQKSPFHQLHLVRDHPELILAFTFTITLVLSTFTIIPSIGPFYIKNLGYTESQLSWIYFTGGLFTLVTMNLFGWLTDRLGAARVFTVLASATLIMTGIVTNLPPVPLPVGVGIAALFMVVASGRMVPAQSVMIGLTEAKDRGSFMSLNSAFQQFGIGLAPILMGFCVVKLPDGKLEGYPVAGLLAGSFAILAILQFRLLLTLRARSQMEKKRESRMNG